MTQLLGGSLLLAALGTGTAAATLTVLRGSPIPAPRAADLQPLMTQRPSTQRISALRAANPDGLPFTLRTGTSEGGLACVTVGQLEGERFGLVGTDDVFRPMPATVVDGCGRATAHGAAVIGVRILDDPDYGQVRSVLYGLGGAGLRSATAIVRGERRPLELRDGAFVLALAGYPEDNGLALRLVYADGTATTHELGRMPGLATDLAGGPAWQIFSSGPSRRGGLASNGCVTAFPVRQTTRSPSIPSICGGPAGRPWLFDVRRFSGHASSKDPARPLGLLPSAGSTGENGYVLGRLITGEWGWRGAPARTIAWGYAAPSRVRTVTVVSGARRFAAAVDERGGFAVIMPASVDPGRARIVFAMRDGSTRRFSGPALSGLRKRTIR